MIYPMSVMSDVRNALNGAIRLACLDRGGFDCFDRSETGFWKSFRAAALLYPVFLAMVLRAGWLAETEDYIRPLVIQSGTYVLTWLVFPVVMAPICDLLGRRERYIGFIVAYNWSQIPQYGFSLILLGLGTGIDSAIGTIPIFLYEGFIASVALDIGWMRAAMIVLVDYILGTGIDILAGQLL